MPSENNRSVTALVTSYGFRALRYLAAKGEAKGGRMFIEVEVIPAKVVETLFAGRSWHAFPMWHGVTERGDGSICQITWPKVTSSGTCCCCDELLAPTGESEES